MTRATVRVPLSCLLLVVMACDEPGSAPPPEDRTPLEPLIILMQKEFFGLPEAGRGWVIEAMFAEMFAADAQFGHAENPVWEQAKKTPFGCKVWDFQPEEGPGLDEGILTFAIEGGPTIPPCTFVPGESTAFLRGGYRCSSASGSGGDIKVMDSENALFSLTDPATTFTDDDVGRYLQLAGTSVPGNDGQFPIVARIDDHTVQFKNPNPSAAEELATGANHTVYAGFGPAFQTDDIPANSQVHITYEPGGGLDLDAFDLNLDIGNTFTLDTESQGIIANLPMDGSEFSIGCSEEGGVCGQSGASIFEVRTTDAPITPDMPGWYRPPAVGHSIQMVCIVLAGRMTISADASAYLASSGATRLEATFARGYNALRRQPNADIRMAAAHAVTGFTTIAPE